jgi:hypothetical protein
MQKSTRFLPEIMRPVSSANIMGIAKVFIVGGKPFIWVMKSKGPKLDPCGTPCFIVPQVGVALGDFISSFCFLPVR